MVSLIRYAFFREADVDGSGEVTFDEFQLVVRKKLNLAPACLPDCRTPCIASMMQRWPTASLPQPPRASTWCTPQVGCPAAVAAATVPAGRPGPACSCVAALAVKLAATCSMDCVPQLTNYPPARLPACLPSAGGKLEAVSSSARWEDVVGYSRAAKRGPFIFVSGGWLGMRAAGAGCCHCHCSRGAAVMCWCAQTDAAAAHPPS